LVSYRVCMAWFIFNEILKQIHAKPITPRIKISGILLYQFLRYV
jgi:hypothetical protein